MYRIQKKDRFEGRWLGMPKQRGRFVFHLRFWVICAALLFVIFLPLFRAQEHQAQKQREQLAALQQEQYEGILHSERLKNQIENAETDSFREREARRRYGYVMPGIIRFTAEGAVAAPEQDAVAVFAAPEDAAPQTGETTDKDWANFNR